MVTIAGAHGRLNLGHAVRMRNMNDGVSEVYAEDGQVWLRVSPGHSVSEDWLTEHASTLYADWWAAQTGDARDEVARQIE